MFGSGYRKHHRDATHAEIAEALEAFGWTVEDTSKLGGDFPDMVIGQGGITDMVEAKSGAKAKLQPGQKTFAEKWRGRPVVVLRSRSEAEAWARRERHERRRLSEMHALMAIKSL